MDEQTTVERQEHSMSHTYALVQHPTSGERYLLDYDTTASDSGELVGICGPIEHRDVEVLMAAGTPENFAPYEAEDVAWWHEQVHQHGTARHLMTWDR